MFWGFSWSEESDGRRCTGTIGLGVAVREFNDLAVPGFGGICFGKQVFLATLGVAVAERARNSGSRCRNIEVASAVEALARWTTFKSSNWIRDSRLRGAMKMRDKPLIVLRITRRSLWLKMVRREDEIVFTSLYVVKDVNEIRDSNLRIP